MATGLVTTRHQGNRVYYRLASDRVAALWGAVRDVAAVHHAELDQLAAAYLGDRRGIEEVSREELARRLGAGDLVILDVRPTPEFVSGHIAGARSTPIDDLAQQLRALPDGEVVTYCRGPFCVFADDAVRQLRRNHRPARRLEDGFPEWRRAGLPVAVGTQA